MLGVRELSIPAGWRRVEAGQPGGPGLPTLGEALFYLRRTGLVAAAAEVVAAFVIGRRRWYITREALTRWDGLRAEAPAGVELRYGRESDLPVMARFAERQYPETLRTWCGPDHYFFIALCHGEAVAYRCLARAVHPLVEGFLGLEPHQLYVVDEFTAPAFRRRGLTRQLAIAMNPRLRMAGFTEVVGIHRTDNEATRAATRAKAIATVGTLTRWCVLGRVRYTLSAPERARPGSTGPASPPRGSRR